MPPSQTAATCRRPVSSIVAARLEHSPRRMTWIPDQIAGGRFVGAGVAAGFADGAGACYAGAPEPSADGDGDGGGAEAAGALQAATSRAIVRIASDRGVRYMIIPIWSVPAGRRPPGMTPRGVGCVGRVGLTTASHHGDLGDVSLPHTWQEDRGCMPRYQGSQRCSWLGCW